MGPTQFLVPCEFRDALETVFGSPQCCASMYLQYLMLHIVSQRFWLSVIESIYMYTSRFSRASVVMILHSMRMPLFLCIISSYQHYIQPPIEATIMYHHLYMYWLAPMFWDLIPLFILLALLWAWVCLLHPYTCHTLYVSHPFFRTHNKKPKSIVAQTRKLHFSMGLSSLFVVVTITPMILWCTSAIRWAPALTHQGEIC